MVAANGQNVYHFASWDEEAQLKARGFGLYTNDYGLSGWFLINGDSISRLCTDRSELGLSNENGVWVYGHKAVINNEIRSLINRHFDMEKEKIKNSTKFIRYKTLRG